MLNVLSLLTLLLFVDAGENQTNSSRKLQPRIWGGTATHISHFPFYVGLYMTKKNTICGGTLISNYFVLTAAHCIVKVDKNTNRWEITPEVVLYFGTSISYSVEKNNPYNYYMIVDKTGIIPHQSYDHRKILNDIGLIRLPYEATLNPYVQVANLSSINGNIDNVDGLTLFSAGWGRLGDDENKRPTELQYMITQIVDGKECTTFTAFDNRMQICVNAPKRSLCPGDSGGPSVIFAPKPILIGLTSYGSKESCQAGLPQVLTRVSYYLPWIHNRTTEFQPVNYKL